MRDAADEISDIRAKWGRRLVILGHHYQRSAVLRHADAIGDSLELSRKAAACTEAERIVFCGVKFMAESADILTGAQQAVYMPETGAGCPMANMLTGETMQAAWASVNRVSQDWVPVLYVNSTAETKALCGRWGGLTCTSSNAGKVFNWVFAQGKRIFFMPDEHLGRNTARDLGLPADAVSLYDRQLPDGGVDAATLARTRVLVWKGYCLVHTAFSLEQVKLVREKLPEAKIIVHPETPIEVVAACDAHGSTSQIIDYVKAQPDGAMIVIGTELNLIHRLAEEYAGRKTIKALSPSVCANMAKTNERNLLAVLQDWPDRQRVTVDPEAVAEARMALDRMLSL